MKKEYCELQSINSTQETLLFVQYVCSIGQLTIWCHDFRYYAYEILLPCNGWIVSGVRMNSFLMKIEYSQGNYSELGYK